MLPICELVQRFGLFGQAISEKIFINRTTRNKNSLWRPCVLTDRDESTIFIEYTFHKCILSSVGSFGGFGAED